MSNITGSVICMTLLVTLGCSPRAASLRPSPEDPHSALACERELVFVDTILARCDSDPSFPRGRLAEAKELRNMAVELYLERDFVLALELLAEAVSILKE